MSDPKLRVQNLKDPSIRTLHFAWVAFFLTFVIWFNHAPLMVYLRESLGLDDQQVKGLLILNVALTIPARIGVGMIVDHFGPRVTYTGLLVVAGLLCMAFAMVQTFEQAALARFALGLVGAGFVVGIRLVSEWFPARHVGLAEGIYGGWGNFGSAAAAMSLPALAILFGGPEGWRFAIGVTGAFAMLYALVFYRAVRNTPKGSTYFKPKRSGGLEVTSRRDLVFYIVMNLPMYAALGVLVWKLSPGNLDLLSGGVCNAIGVGLAVLCAFQTRQIFKVNRDVLEQPVPELYRYAFKQVAVLDLAYFITFGAELAVVSMLPLFFIDTFEGLDPVMAGLLAATFAFTNLVARPAGGWFSDRFGRRRTLTVGIAGLAVGYLLLSRIDGSWPLGLAVLATMCASAFGQAGSGAVFAMVPLVQRRMTGQIAGMVGAYGNVGGVIFLTVFSFVDYATFFVVIAATAGLGIAGVQFMDEPEGHMAEIREDGTVELIEVA